MKTETDGTKKVFHLSPEEMVNVQSQTLLTGQQLAEFIERGRPAPGELFVLGIEAHTRIAERIVELRVRGDVAEEIRKMEPRVAPMAMTVKQASQHACMSQTKIRALIHKRVLSVIPGDPSLGEGRKTKHLVLKKELDDYLRKRAKKLPSW